MLLSGPRRIRSRSQTSSSKHRCAIAVGQLEVRLLMAADVTAPLTVASVVGPLGNDGYYRGPVVLNLTATDVDNPSSDLTTFASVNGGPNVAEHVVPLTSDGLYTVNYFSEDPAGNIEVTHTQVIRIDRTAPVVTSNANPTMLFPPNHKLVPVTVTGHISDNLSGIVHKASYQVVDEYGQAHPSGTITVDSGGDYRFVVRLPSSRLGQDKDGRQFTIIVTASDLAGNVGTSSTTVTVLHDRGHHNGQGQIGGVASHHNPKGHGHPVAHGHQNQHANSGSHGKQNHGNAGHGHKV